MARALERELGGSSSAHLRGSLSLLARAAAPRKDATGSRARLPEGVHGMRPAVRFLSSAGSPSSRVTSPSRRSTSGRRRKPLLQPGSRRQGLGACLCRLGVIERGGREAAGRHSSARGTSARALRPVRALGGLLPLLRPSWNSAREALSPGGSSAQARGRLLISVSDSVNDLGLDPLLPETPTARSPARNSGCHRARAERHVSALAGCQRSRPGGMMQAVPRGATIPLNSLALRSAGHRRSGRGRARATAPRPLLETTSCASPRPGPQGLSAAGGFVQWTQVSERLHGPVQLAPPVSARAAPRRSRPNVVSRRWMRRSS